MNRMLGRIQCLLVLFFATRVSTNCDFPPEWTDKRWMTERQQTTPAVYGLMTYTNTEAYASTSNTPDSMQATYTCEAFETTDEHRYYITMDNNTCVEDLHVNGVILHKANKGSSPWSTLAECKTALAAQSVYNAYLPVSVAPPDVTFDSSVNCPFLNVPYRVTYTISENHNECAGNTESLLSVSGSTINILACNYEYFPRLPLTGSLRCLTVIDPVELGEPDDSNGGILLMKWDTRTQEDAFIYCARYHIFENKNITISLDITSADEVQCKKGARYDWYGRQDAREYFTLNLSYELWLVSPPVTQRTATATRPTPQSSTTPSSIPHTSVHMQFALEHSYDLVLDTPNFIQSVEPTLTEMTGVDVERITHIMIHRATDGNVVVTFDMADGSPTISEVRDLVITRVQTGQYFVVTTEDGTDVFAVRNSFYQWKDEDPCPSAICQNGGLCWVLQGEYSCNCALNFTGPICADKDKMIAPSSDGINSTTLTIIIVVCCAVGLVCVILVIVFVVRRQRRDKHEPDSEPGFDSDGSLEDRDREMYSTINKKPKAYHDRSFTNLADDHHGEQTGIRGVKL